MPTGKINMMLAWIFILAALGTAIPALIFAIQLRNGNKASASRDANTLNFATVDSLQNIGSTDAMTIPTDGTKIVTLAAGLTYPNFASLTQRLTTGAGNLSAATAPTRATILGKELLKYTATIIDSSGLNNTIADDRSDLYIDVQQSQSMTAPMGVLRGAVRIDTGGTDIEPRLSNYSYPSSKVFWGTVSHVQYRSNRTGDPGFVQRYECKIANNRVYFYEVTVNRSDGSETRRNLAVNSTSGTYAEIHFEVMFELSLSSLVTITRAIDRT